MSLPIEVRCCCNPQKLMGWLSIVLRPGQRDHRFVVRANDPREHWTREGMNTRASVSTREIVLPLDTFVPLFSRPHVRSRAFRSEEIPIEVLRLLPYFHEMPSSS